MCLSGGYIADRAVSDPSHRSCWQVQLQNLLWKASTILWEVVFTRQGFFMGIPFLDFSPTAHPSNSTVINSGCESKKAFTSGLFQPVEGLGHSKETVPPNFRINSALLVKLWKSRFDWRSWSAKRFIKAAPPFFLFMYCHGEPEVHGIDDQRCVGAVLAASSIW